MFDMSRYNTLKVKVSRMKGDVERAEGAIDEIKRRLKAEFGCKSLADAMDKKKQLIQDISELEKSLNQKMTEFEDDFGEKLDAIRQLSRNT